jgi:hypothetical protein
MSIKPYIFQGVLESLFTLAFSVVIFALLFSVQQFFVIEQALAPIIDRVSNILYPIFIERPLGINASIPDSNFRVLFLVVITIILTINLAFVAVFTKNIFEVVFNIKSSGQNQFAKIIQELFKAGLVIGFLLFIFGKVTTIPYISDLLYSLPILIHILDVYLRFKQNQSLVELILTKKMRVI